MVELPPGAVPVDPFAHFRNVKSKIEGLGGSEFRPEFQYAFHTDYLHCRPGHCTFIAQFYGLAATSGTLNLNVHMLSVVEGSHAHVATTERVPFVDLVVSEGRASVRFEALRGHRYALYGMVLGDTDAASTGLSLWLDGLGSADQASAAQEPPSAYGSDEQVRRIDALAQFDSQPTLALPSSQGMTAAQLGEAVFRDRKARFPALSTDELWQDAFLLQAMRGFGFVEQNVEAIVLTFAVGEAERELEACGVQVGVVGGLNPDGSLIGGQALASRFYEFPLTCDVLYSRGIIERLTSTQDVQKFILHAFEWIKLGGLAVHLLRCSPDLYASVVDADGRLILSANDLTRIALNCVSYGHALMQLKLERHGMAVADGEEIRAFPFGLILRKGAR